jgi:hypothetical protein
MHKTKRIKKKMDTLIQNRGQKRRCVQEHPDVPCPKKQRLNDLYSPARTWKAKRSSVDVLLGRFSTG